MLMLDILMRAIRASARFNPGSEVNPNCILWPDGEAQWLAAMPLLQAAMPELYILGQYEPQKRQGPAIWLRCILASAIPDLPPAGAYPPIFYLPHVSRRDLRAVDSCRESLKPLAWLQYSGAVFCQPNGRDWTCQDLLASSQAGFGLNLDESGETAEALLLALAALLQDDSAQFAGKKLDAVFLNRWLAGGDPIREILLWLNDEAAFRATRDASTWQAFSKICKSDYGFDPEADGSLSACALLAGRKGGWLKIWRRYAESWRAYPRIAANIHKCSPPADSLNWYLCDEANTGWPQWNENQEKSLARDLDGLAQQGTERARARILELDKLHKPRRGLLWAEMGQARLAQALGHLATLVLASQNALASGSFAELAAAYGQEGWQADNAALLALAAVENARDRQLVAAILANIYEPWLNDSSLYLQKLATGEAWPGCYSPETLPGDCILFVDGLRYDIAKRLSGLLTAKGLTVAETGAWAALPSVTPTGKPAVSPCRELIAGLEENADFEPSVKATGKPLKGHLHGLLVQSGFEVLKADECGSGQGNAWTEFGKIDHGGHAEGAGLAPLLPGLLARVSARVLELLGAGWLRVHVVTDHGWLLLPGGLPRYNLEATLTENKWGRCACIKSGANSGLAQYPWYWNQTRYFASAPGISCFKNSQEYSHGGISLQECLTLALTISPRAACQGHCRLDDVIWRGLRCKARITGVSPGLAADLRMRPGDASTSLLAAPARLKPDGSLAVIVEDEDLEGKTAYLVILDQNGAILAQAETTIGG